MIATWTYFILQIIPQTDSTGGPSLQSAETNGQLCTVPLVLLIQKTLPQFAWLGNFLTAFVLISLSVSFISVGSALKQQIDGYIKAFRFDLKTEGSYVHDIVGKNLPQNIIYLFEFSLYLFSYATIIIIALINPSGLFLILERSSSLSLNITTGIFISLAFIISRKKKTKISLPIFWFVGEFTVWFVMFYFLIAIIWDIVSSIGLLYFTTSPSPF